MSLFGNWFSHSDAVRNDVSRAKQEIDFQRMQEKTFDCYSEYPIHQNMTGREAASQLSKQIACEKIQARDFGQNNSHVHKAFPRLSDRNIRDNTFSG